MGSNLKSAIFSVLVALGLLLVIIGALFRFGHLILRRPLEVRPDVLIAAITAMVLALQLVVFGIQAERLHESVEVTREVAKSQSADMQASIAAATRAAAAMEIIAKATAENVASIKETVATTKEMAERAKIVSELQTRAYLSVTYLGMVPQNPKTGYRFEARMALVNNGNTPAYNVHFRAAADVLPFPLPDDFSFPLPEEAPNASAGMLAPRLNFITSAVAPKVYSDSEVNEIKTGQSRRLYFWGVVTYEDAFGITRDVKFGEYVVWMADGTSTTVFNTARHNDAN